MVRVIGTFWLLVPLLLGLGLGHGLALALALETGKPGKSTAANDTKLETRHHPRGGRALTFPYPAQTILIFGLGTPLQLDRESVIVGLFAKMQYDMPGNATDYTMPGVRYARAAARTRWSIYKTFERIAAVYGFGGKECLLRAICEAARIPFDQEHGLLGQLLQTFFRPSSTEEQYQQYQDREYRAAERLGQQLPDENCHALYPECRTSVLDVFSTVLG